MHEYTVSLRIAGALDLKSVTDALGLEPTHVVNIGDLVSGGPAKRAVWEFEVFPQDSESWHSLEEALVELLGTFDHRLPVVRRLQETFAVLLWCGHFSSSFDGGPTFSAALLRRLADFGVELYLDTYFSNSSADANELS